MKKLNIIKIDSVRKTVELSIMQDSLPGIYVSLECDMFTVAAHLPNNDLLLVDEESLIRNLKTAPTGFIIEIANEHLFFGQGVIVGFNEAEGNHLDCTSKLAEILSKVSFPSQEVLNANFLRFSGRPSSDIPA